MWGDINERIIRAGDGIYDPDRQRGRGRSDVQPKLLGNVMFEKDGLGRVESADRPIVVRRLHEPVGNIAVAAGRQERKDQEEKV
jgi:hypothetical protein